jgi:hypothetical protein
MREIDGVGESETPRKHVCQCAVALPLVRLIYTDFRKGLQVAYKYMKR